MVYRIIIFLVLNFAALGIGGFFTGKGVPSIWYVELNKAPWTPPGWMFGVAWSTIMVCFSVYLSIAYHKLSNRSLLLALFGVQWILNVSWNPTFFYFHYTVLGLNIIILLTLLIGFFLFFYFPKVKYYSILVLPYFVWLCIATSLNAYVVLKN